MYVQTILDVHKKYNALVMSAFNNDAGFVAALDKVFKSSCNGYVNRFWWCKCLRKWFLFRLADALLITMPLPRWCSPQANLLNYWPDTATRCSRKGVRCDCCMYYGRVSRIVSCICCSECAGCKQSVVLISAPKTQRRQNLKTLSIKWCVSHYQINGQLLAQQTFLLSYLYWFPFLSFVDGGVQIHRGQRRVSEVLCKDAGQTSGPSEQC